MIFIAIILALFPTFSYCADNDVRPLAVCPTYVDEGDALSCTCRPSKLGISANISWPGHSSSPQLRLANVSREDNGTHFKCRMVLNERTTDVVYTLQVAYGPSNDISISGPSMYITDGSKSMALTCKANDVNPEPLYRWIGVICDEGNDGSRCSFTPDPDWHDGRSVTCTAANPSSYADLSSSAHFVMNISSTPKILNYNQAQVLRAGDYLTCLVSGGKSFVSSVHFSCTSPDHPDGPDDRSGSSVSSSLTIDTSRAIGVDTECVCSVVWELGQLRHTETLKKTYQLQYKTEVARFTANDNRDATTVSENMQVVFRCSAVGRPAPNLTIHRLDTDSPLSRVSGKQEIIHTDKSISCQEAGTYVCTAENGFPSPDSRTIDVSVKCGSEPGTLDDKTRLKIIIVGGGASGGVVIVVVAIIIICRCGYRRYERPPSRRDEDEENPYTGLNVRATPPELPPRRGNYELPQLTQSTVDENLYDDLAIRDAEQTPKKRRLLCPNKRKKKTNRVDRDSI